MGVWGSFEEVHVIDFEGAIDESLKPTQKLQLIHFSLLNLAMLLEYSDSILLLIHLRAEIGVIIDEVIEEGRDDDVVIGGGVGVGVDAEVDVDGDH